MDVIPSCWKRWKIQWGYGKEDTKMFKGDTTLEVGSSKETAERFKQAVKKSSLKRRLKCRKASRSVWCFWNQIPMLNGMIYRQHTYGGTRWYSRMQNMAKAKCSKQRTVSSPRIFNVLMIYCYLNLDIIQVSRMRKIKVTVNENKTNNLARSHENASRENELIVRENQF